MQTQFIKPVDPSPVVTHLVLTKTKDMFKYLSEYGTEKPVNWGKIWMWVFIVSVVLASFISSRFQDPLKILFWTSVVAYAYLPPVLPYVRSLATAIVFIGICLGHIAVVWCTYPSLPEAGYLAIALVAFVELLVVSVPGGWIIAHSPKRQER